VPEADRSRVEPVVNILAPDGQVYTSLLSDFIPVRLAREGNDAAF
jgi:hypothetical protein